VIAPPEGRDAGDAFWAGVSGIRGTGASSRLRLEFSRQARRASSDSPRHSAGSESVRGVSGAKPSGCAGPSGSRPSPDRLAGLSAGRRSLASFVIRSFRGCAGSAPGGSAAQAGEAIAIAPDNASARGNLLAILRSVRRRREAADRSLRDRSAEQGECPRGNVDSTPVTLLLNEPRWEPDPRKRTRRNCPPPPHLTIQT